MSGCRQPCPLRLTVWSSRHDPLPRSLGLDDVLSHGHIPLVGPFLHRGHLGGCSLLASVLSPQLAHIWQCFRQPAEGVLRPPAARREAVGQGERAGWPSTRLAPCAGRSALLKGAAHPRLEGPQGPPLGKCLGLTVGSGQSRAGVCPCSSRSPWQAWGGISKTLGLWLLVKFYSSWDVGT